VRNNAGATHLTKVSGTVEGKRKGVEQSNYRVGAILDEIGSSGTKGRQGTEYRKKGGGSAGVNRRAQHSKGKKGEGRLQNQRAKKSEMANAEDRHMETRTVGKRHKR